MKTLLPALFLLGLFGPVLAVLVGVVLFALPSKGTTRSSRPASSTHE